MEEKDLPQLVREFVEALVLYMRQQGREWVTAVTMPPLRRAGTYLLILTAVGALLVLGIIFAGLGAVLGFAQVLGSLSAAYGLIGMVLLIAAFVVYRLGVSAKDQKGTGDNGVDKTGS